MEEGKKQKHFVLVHGACHGAWCWYKVTTRLRLEGHHVTALDMASAGANPKRVEELSSFSDYCRPLMEFFAALPPEERVVLVGHSMGRICISVAMEKFPEKIALAVFATAFMPGPDFTVLAVAREDLTLATLLVRPVGYYDDADILKEAPLSKENYGTVRRAYVLCEQDKVLTKGFQEWMIENNPTDEVKIIFGADHRVMFSKSQELCGCLQDLADKYC